MCQSIGGGDNELPTRAYHSVVLHSLHIAATQDFTSVIVAAALHSRFRSQVIVNPSMCEAVKTIWGHGAQLSEYKNT
jgi:hypothetical protein